MLTKTKKMKKYSSGITSPTSGKKYTIEDGIQKFFSRSALKDAVVKFLPLHQCFYKSTDGVLEVLLSPTKPQMGNSVNVTLSGPMPAHFMENGQFSWGFSCGCDSRHGGQYPSQSNPDNPDWAKYQNEHYPLILNFYGPQGEYCGIDLSLLPKGKRKEKIFSDIKKIVGGALFQGIQWSTTGI